MTSLTVDGRLTRGFPSPGCHRRFRCRLIFLTGCASCWPRPRTRGARRPRRRRWPRRRRSWMLGYCAAVTARVRAAEEAAVASAPAADAGAGGPSAALVLADRSLVVRRRVAPAYPRLRKSRITYTGNGYGAGYREGQKADIGGAKLRSRAA